MGKLCITAERKDISHGYADRENYKHHVRNVTEDELETLGGESDESEASIHRIKRINRITDRNKCLTAVVKINGIEEEFIVDTESPGSIIPVDEKTMKQTDIQKVKERFQDVNKNEVKIRGKLPANIEYENTTHKMQILITKRNDITPLFGMHWMKKINLSIENIPLEDNVQSERDEYSKSFQIYSRTTPQ